MDSVVAAIQARNVLKISRDVSRIRDDNEGIKALLAASNEPCFELTSNPTMRMKNNKYYMCIWRRPDKNSIKGKRVNSSCYLSKKSAEMDLFPCRLSIESPNSRDLTMKKIDDIVNNSTIPSTLNLQILKDDECCASSLTSPNDSSSSDASSLSRVGARTTLSFDGPKCSKKQKKRRAMSNQRESLDSDSVYSRNPNSSGIFGKNFNQ